MCNSFIGVFAHTYVHLCIHALLKIIYWVTQLPFFLLCAHAGRQLHLKVKLLKDIMLTTVAETAEVAELRKIFL